MPDRTTHAEGDALLSARDAAAALAVSPRTLHRYEGRGYIVAVKTPLGVRRYRAEDVERLRVEGVPKPVALAQDTG